MPDKPDEFAALREAVRQADGMNDGPGGTSLYWYGPPPDHLLVIRTLSDAEQSEVFRLARLGLAVDDLLAKHDVPALLATIRAATPGPWVWRINRELHQVQLRTRRHDYVMDFVRYGMANAAPRFNVNGLMHRADELAAVIPGEEHHAHWNQDIDHPDAKFITALSNTLAPFFEAVAKLAGKEG